MMTYHEWCAAQRDALNDCWNCNTPYAGEECPNGCDDIPEEVRHQTEATWRVEGREPPMRYCQEGV